MNKREYLEELTWTAIVVVFCIWAFVTVTGCAGSLGAAPHEFTQKDAKRCRNTNGMVVVDQRTGRTYCNYSGWL